MSKMLFLLTLLILLVDFFLYVLVLKFLHIATLMYSMDNEFENKYQLKANLLTPEAFD